MIYMDNGATTPICEEAASAVQNALKSFGNPSSPYGIGIEAKSRVRACGVKIEKIINAEDGTFYFTSGATEANNWAIFGVAAANARRGQHIITSKTEHPSVLEPINALEKDGFSVTRIDVDSCGNLDLDKLFAAIRSDTVMVSIMNVNNETGTLNDVAKIGNMIKQINSGAVFHVDGVCSFCKIPVDVRASRIDLFSVSGHKLHAPKGIGGLYIRKGTRINTFIHGGGQQNGMRSGTENTAFIEAFAAAAELCANELEESHGRVSTLKRALAAGLTALGATINGETDTAKASPYVLNASFPGMKSQLLINALEECLIYVSGGSACSTNKSRANLSGTLTAMGLEKALIEGAVRFSFSKYSTMYEVETVLGALEAIIGKYGRIRHND